MDFVDAAPAPELTLSLVEQLMEIIELQAASLRALRPLVVRLAARHRSGIRSRLSSESVDGCRRAFWILLRGVGLG